MFAFDSLGTSQGCLAAGSSKTSSKEEQRSRALGFLGIDHTLQFKATFSLPWHQLQSCLDLNRGESREQRRRCFSSINVHRHPGLLGKTSESGLWSPVSHWAAFLPGSFSTYTSVFAQQEQRPLASISLQIFKWWSGGPWMEPTTEVPRKRYLSKQAGITPGEEFSLIGTLNWDPLKSVINSRSLNSSNALSLKHPTTSPNSEEMFRTWVKGDEDPSVIPLQRPTV